jgi:hypothetical protein
MLLAVLTVAGPACAPAMLQSAQDFREKNRENVARLRIGLSRTQVLSVMGTGSPGRPLGSETGGVARTEQDTMGVTRVQIPLGSRGPILQNPMRTATYTTPDSRWEVLFYYTDLVEDDGLVTEDELTPLVLRDDVLIGMGWEFWEQEARSNGFEIDRDL